MPAKIAICRCEDVMLADIEHAMRLGYTDIEEVKRFTGLGTGPCEGKECMALVARVIAERVGRPASEIRPFTARPPVQTVALATLARGDERDEQAPAPKKTKAVRR